jgi:hypothetical protein
MTDQDASEPLARRCSAKLAAISGERHTFAMQTNAIE